MFAPCRMTETEDCVGPGVVTLCGPGHQRMDFCSQAGTQELSHRQTWIARITPDYIINSKAKLAEITFSVNF